MTQPTKETESDAVLEAATNMVVTLEDVLQARAAKTRRSYTGQFASPERLNAAIEKIRRGIDEVRELSVLNPKCAARYHEQFGIICAETAAA
jgi:hypothetical protein